MCVAIAINCARVAWPRATLWSSGSIAAPRSAIPPGPARLTNRLSVCCYKPTVGLTRLTRLTRKASVMQLSELEARRHAAATRSGEISYLDVGTGPVALFVHGIATNAYLWRHVIGGRARHARAAAAA